MIRPSHHIFTAQQGNEETMKILGLNSTVTVNGVSAKVTGIQSKTITLTGSKDTLNLSLRKVNKMIDEKTLKIL